MILIFYLTHKLLQTNIEVGIKNDNNNKYRNHVNI